MENIKITFDRLGRSDFQTLLARLKKSRHGLTESLLFRNFLKAMDGGLENLRHEYKEKVCKEFGEYNAEGELTEMDPSETNPAPFKIREGKTGAEFLVAHQAFGDTEIEVKHPRFSAQKLACLKEISPYELDLLEPCLTEKSLQTI